MSSTPFPKPEELVIDEYEYQKAAIIRLLKEGNGQCVYKRTLNSKLAVEMRDAGWTLRWRDNTHIEIYQQ